MVSVRKVRLLRVRGLLARIPLVFSRVRRLLAKILLVLAVVSILALVLWKVPEWQVRQYKGVSEDQFPPLVDEHRKTLAQIIGGLGLLYGLYFTWRRLEIAQEGQVTERFTRAIEHLGSEKLEVRLGGIYALERIARDSQEDHWPVMEVLTACVRNAPRKAPPDEQTGSHKEWPGPPEEIPKKLATDIQAILTVLGRRERGHEKAGQFLDLKRTDLRRAILQGAHLEGAILQRAHLEGAELQAAHLEGAKLQEARLERAKLWEAHLEGAKLQEARLEGAELMAAHLEGAKLEAAHLEGAKLEEAHLEGAKLEEAYLEGAELWGAHLEGAKLEEADLSKVRNLTQEQINKASGNEETKLPEELVRPAHWGESRQAD